MRNPMRSLAIIGAAIALLAGGAARAADVDPAIATIQTLDTALLDIMKNAIARWSPSSNRPSTCR